MINFLHPLGLIGLVGIPLVIIIYLLKNKYNEKIISSTYIWDLSEKFLKKKNPIHKINGLLSLILQIIAITVLSLIIASPIITIKNNARNYMFIIDSSSSMKIVDENKISRFDRAKEKINEIVKDSKNGSFYSLIYASDDSSLILNKSSSKDSLYNAVNSIEVSSFATSLDNALELMQGYYYEDSSYDVYVLTDKDFIESNNVSIINVSSNEINSAITAVNYTYYDNNNIRVYGTIITYGSDKDLNVSLFVDDEFIKSLQLKTYNEIETTFTFDTTLQEFNKIEVVLDDDSLNDDNNYIIYSNESTNDFQTLIVSEQPTFLSSVLKVLGNKSIKVITPSNYNDSFTGYSLYVFDSFSPSSLPSDGTIWLFNVDSNVSQSGFTIQGVQNLKNGGKLDLNKENSATYKTLSANLIGNDIYVSKYQKYSLYNDATILYKYNNDPMVFAMLNNYNNREVVFSFDLHDSNFALQLDFVPLFKNLVNYSIPSVLERNNYTIGEDVNVNVLPFTESIRVNYPSNKSKYLDVSKSVTSFEVNEIGSYEIIITTNNVNKKFNIFVNYNFNESKTNETLNDFSLVGNEESKGLDEKYDALTVLTIVALLFLLIDWGVYIYEQH